MGWLTIDGDFAVVSQGSPTGRTLLDKAAQRVEGARQSSHLRGNAQEYCHSEQDQTDSDRAGARGGLRKHC